MKGKRAFNEMKILSLAKYLKIDFVNIKQNKENVLLFDVLQHNPTRISVYEIFTKKESDNLKKDTIKLEHDFYCNYIKEII